MDFMNHLSFRTTIPVEENLTASMPVELGKNRDASVFISYSDAFFARRWSVMARTSFSNTHTDSSALYDLFNVNSVDYSTWSIFLMSSVSIGTDRSWILRASVYYNTPGKKPLSHTTEGKIDSLDGDIILRDVTYKYPGSDSQPVIGGLGLTIPRGKTTAIVGPSGCGKSTLMKFLQGLYHPQQGSITAGMVDVATLQPQEWGKICTSVSRQGYIFSDTIARNIALGDESPDMERVADAACTACLGPLLDKLPLKLHTLIGPSGMELSGGERQRLMIARAVYRDTPVILLDEATSSLDAETERRIVANLSGFGQGRTMVIAAHRLSTVSNADLILFMDSGRIIEQGTHSSLMSLGGRYASFVSGQLTS